MQRFRSAIWIMGRRVDRQSIAVAAGSVSVCRGENRDDQTGAFETTHAPGPWPRPQGEVLRVVALGADNGTAMFTRDVIKLGLRWKPGVFGRAIFNRADGRPKHRGPKERGASGSNSHTHTPSRISGDQRLTSLETPGSRVTCFPVAELGGAG